MASDFARFERALLFSDALRPLNSEQVVAGDEDVRQRTGYEEPVGILRDAAGPMSAQSSPHGTTRSISARNGARRVVLENFSNPGPASVICLLFIVPCSFC